MILKPGLSSRPCHRILDSSLHKAHLPLRAHPLPLPFPLPTVPAVSLHPCLESLDPLRKHANPNTQRGRRSSASLNLQQPRRATTHWQDLQHDWETTEGRERGTRSRQGK